MDRGHGSAAEDPPAQLLPGDYPSQRWRGRRDLYRPAREVIDTSIYSVDLIAERPAKEFVIEHHYSGSYPAARLRAGLFGPGKGRRPELQGVAVFSVPMNNRAAARHAGLEPQEAVDLGRFVLLDEVGANAETFFLARALKLLQQERPELRCLLSYSDPLPRRALSGEVTHAGHVGCIYQAANAHYAGRATARTLILGRTGRVISDRALSKIRRGERGLDYASRQLEAEGAEPRRPGEAPGDWLKRVLPHFRRQRHPGNHLYLFALGDRRQRRALAQCIAPAQSYPKALDTTT